MKFLFGKRCSNALVSLISKPKHLLGVRKRKQQQLVTDPGFPLQVAGKENESILGDFGEAACKTGLTGCSEHRPEDLVSEMN